MNTGRSLHTDVGKLLGDHLEGLGAFRSLSFSHDTLGWREVLTEGGKVRS